MRAKGFEVLFFGCSHMKTRATSNQMEGDENNMTYLNDLGRRSFLKMAAALGGASTVGACPTSLAPRIHHYRLTPQP